MSAETFTYATLSAASSVTALVSQKIYPDIVTEAAPLPYVAFERAGSEPEWTLDNTLAGVRVRMQVACWADTRIKAEELGDAVILAMLAATVPYSERDALFDFDTGAYASILGFDIWE